VEKKNLYEVKFILDANSQIVFI